MDRKSNRSNGYQHLFAEQMYSNEMMAEFSESQGLVEKYSSEDHEELLNLREQLTVEFWKLVDSELTERQAQVIRLLAKGYTQIEIAKQLGVNQSSITKSVHGNCDYKRNLDDKKNTKKNAKKLVKYGGSQLKLRKLAKNIPEINKIMKQISEIHSKYD